MGRVIGNTLIALLLTAWFLVDLLLGSQRAEKIIDWADETFFE